jgi:hypothetical protein
MGMVVPVLVLMRVIRVMGMVMPVVMRMPVPVPVLMRVTRVMPVSLVVRRRSVVVMMVVGVRRVIVRGPAFVEVVPNGPFLTLGGLVRALLAFTSVRSVLGIALGHDDDAGGITSVWEASVCRALRASQRTAAMAAPKPLSMFTTVTPAAQLDSIPSSAAKPPSEAP